MAIGNSKWRFWGTGRRGSMMLTSRAKSAGGSATEGATGSRRIRAKSTRITRAERWAGGEGCEYISQRPRGVMPTKERG